MARWTTSLVKLALLTTAALLATALAPSADAMTASGEAAASRALVDSARLDAVRSALSVDARLERIARAQSEEMAAQGRVSHNTNLGNEASAAGIDWRWVGENVGVGPDAELIHDGFMDSPSHREVLLEAEATALGIGAALGKDGRLYITQVYANVVADDPVAVAAPMRAAPAPTTAAVRPPSTRPGRLLRSPDPNAVIGGVVTQTVSGLTTDALPTDEQRGWATRSGLRAS